MKGGCHCGDIRYEIQFKPFDADICHCRDCQKVTGSPIGVWMDFKTEQITWLKGVITEYQSSTNIFRGFCLKCGSTLSYRNSDQPAYFTLSITSLDDPNIVEPNYHIYTDNQVNWLTIQDDCKRYPKERS
ncbi:GFA family protein [Thalassotalea fonticola]|uniref:GFA family protein n=1 Tax=Thalassotalea fonticola TaxID=3065649 RepID=A0ABZ0GJ97_9GAMM|nr:GFA family protein [Colwelliaceae bacterium S1-1]